MGMPPHVSLTPKGIQFGEVAFSPLDLSPALWLAADEEVYSDAGTTAAVAEDPVQQWNDLSGNDRHASQATLAARPLFKTNVLNGKPVLRFDGVDDWMRTVAYSQSQPLSILAVVEFGTDSNLNYLCDSNSATSADQVLISPNTGKVRMYADFTVNTGAVTVVQPAVITTVFNGASSKIRFNGGNEGTGDAGPNGITNALNIGTNFSETVFGSKDIAELVVVPSEIDAADIASWESYASSKYGIALA